MRKFAVAVLLALIAAPALAQDDHIQQYREPPKEKSAMEKAADARAERAYQRSLDNVPDQKPVDPWGTARGDDASKKSTAPDKPAVKHSSKAKSGSATN